MADQLLDSTLGDLACTLPGATRVFHQFHLDFCCGGQRPCARLPWSAGWMPTK